MTDEEIIKEFKRWVLAGRPGVWYKRNDGSWGYVSGVPSWNNEDIYIVDDEQVELRKLQIDKPDTKFQYYNEIAKEWQTIQDLNWDFNPSVKYRVKYIKWYEDPNMVYKPIWVRDANISYWSIDIFMSYIDGAEYPFECGRGSWKEAKLVKCEDLYQREKDDK